MNNSFPAQSLIVITSSVKSAFIGWFLPFLGIIAGLLFFWGIITFITASGDDQRDDGKKFMLYGVVGVIIIIGLWGLLLFLLSTSLVPNGPKPSR